MKAHQDAAWYIHNQRVRGFFRALNQWFMAPVLRLGLGPLVGNPLSGYVMLVKTRGRKTGRARYAPVNYAILNGCVYCLSGWREGSQWFRNLVADPRVELVLPGGHVWGTAAVVSDAGEALAATRAVLIAGGFAGFFLGFNPRTAPDELVRMRAQGTPVVRITPTGIGSGPADSGGWLWALLLGALAWRLLRRRRRLPARGRTP